MAHSARPAQKSMPFLLVAPVLEKGARDRDIYLPAGLWKDFWSGDIYHGGKDIENYPAPLDKLPIFVGID